MSRSPAPTDHSGVFVCLLVFSVQYVLVMNRTVYFLVTVSYIYIPRVVYLCTLSFPEMKLLIVYQISTFFFLAPLRFEFSVVKNASCFGARCRYRFPMT